MSSVRMFLSGHAPPRVRRRRPAFAARHRDGSLERQRGQRLLRDVNMVREIDGVDFGLDELAAGLGDDDCSLPTMLFATSGL
jgi:hypothetical protein